MKCESFYKKYWWRRFSIGWESLNESSEVTVRPYSKRFTQALICLKQCQSGELDFVFPDTWCGKWCDRQKKRSNALWAATPEKQFHCLFGQSGPNSGNGKKTSSHTFAFNSWIECIPQLFAWCWYNTHKHTHISSYTVYHMIYKTSCDLWLKGVCFSFKCSHTSSKQPEIIK